LLIVAVVLVLVGAVVARIASAMADPVEYPAIVSARGAADLHRVFIGLLLGMPMVLSSVMLLGCAIAHDHTPRRSLNEHERRALAGDCSAQLLRCFS
jgi:hypothetical protein